MDRTDLISFLDFATTSERAARWIATTLDRWGFTAIDDDFSARGAHIQKGAYIRSGGSVIAIASVPDRTRHGGVLLLAAHTDSPGLRIKHRGTQRRDGLLRVPVEVYGSPILAGWIDRELAIVGRIASTGSRGPIVTEIESRRPMAVIPNLAIHLNKTVNDSLSYDRHEHLQVLVDPGAVGGEDISPMEQLVKIVVPEIPFSAILDADLLVVPSQGAVSVGDRLLMSDRLDNLVGCYTNLDALRLADRVKSPTVFVWVDHEEIGSVSAIGAAGIWIERNLRRLVSAIGIPPEEIETTIRRSLLISNDAAHARHPNFAEKHDAAYAPILAGGPVIKQSAVMRYASPLQSRAWLANIARDRGIPVQYLQNRADIPAGSTIGPAIASRLAVPSIDIGVPLLAMHSPRETICLEDVTTTTTLLSGVIERGIDEISDAH